jgi:hypothetical protein
LSSLQTVKFPWEKVWQRSSSACQCAALRARVLHPLPGSSPPQQIRRAGGPSSHASRQTGSKKTSRLHEKSYSSDHEEQDLLRCLKCARKRRTMMVGISYAREEKGEKSDPWVRFLVKECATLPSQPALSHQSSYSSYPIGVILLIISGENKIAGKVSRVLKSIILY